MRKMKYLIPVVLVLLVTLIIYFCVQSNKLYISNSKKLSRYMGIDFNTEVKIENIKWYYTDCDETVIYLKIRVNKDYTKEVTYFRDNNRTDRINLYANIEEEIRSEGFNIDKIVYDNIIYKEISEKKFFVTAYMPYHIEVFAVNEQLNEAFSEFIVHVNIPIKVSINKSKLLN